MSSSEPPGGGLRSIQSPAVRGSTVDQNPDLQHDALKAVGFYRIFVDTARSALDERPALAKVLDQLPDDALVVWKLDRLGRSLRCLIETVLEIGTASTPGSCSGHPTCNVVDRRHANSYP